MGFGPVRRWRFVERADLCGGNGDGPAITPEGQRYAAPAVILERLGHRTGQSLHCLWNERAGVALGIDGTAFTLNGKKTFLLGASYYAGLGAPDDFIAADFDDLKALGFNWVRVFAVWEMFEHNVSAVDTAGHPREPYLSRLKAIVAAADKRGMVVDVSLGN